MSNTRQTASWYAASANQHLQFPTLQGSREADVCIVGGGYSGLSAAIHLREAGHSVILLEARHMGWGASGRNGGHVGTGQRVDQTALEEKLGLERARELWQLGLEAVDTVTALVSRYAIDCELKAGNLHVAAKAGHAAEFREYANHLQSVYGYDAIRYVPPDELAEKSSARGFYGGLLDTGARHLHPYNYTLGLARAAHDLGAQLFENSPALNWQENGAVTVATANGEVRAKHLILACNGYLEGLAPAIATRIMPINNYMLATQPLPEELARRLIRDDVSMSDSRFVINYWKLSADNRLLFGGGETWSRRFPRDIKAFVRRYMLRVYPELEETAIDHGWGGTLAITMNRMPDFGRAGRNVFYAQGYSGHGVPTATLAGKLICEAICGEPARFDLMTSLPIRRFPGGTLLRWPGLVAGMAWYTLRDRLG